MLRLYLKAPFAAFRPFTAGSFRPTAPFITPSAGYGLVLNIAGVESRQDDGVSPMTVTCNGLPKVRIALGALRFPEVQSIYQQLHNYPVGNTGEAHAGECYGNKYNIQPVCRELLMGLEAYLCIDENIDLEQKVRNGLREGSRLQQADGKSRYGIPFLGDNSFMVDVLREEGRDPRPAYWYRQLPPEIDDDIESVCRLTVWIDRQDMSRTISRLYAPTKTATVEISAEAWTQIEP